MKINLNLFRRHEWEDVYWVCKRCGKTFHKIMVEGPGYCMTEAEIKRAYAWDAAFKKARKKKCRSKSKGKDRGQRKCS